MSELSKEEEEEGVSSIQQSLENREFAAAESRARSLVSRVGLNSANSSSAVHFLARALYSNSKYPEAKLQTDLAIEIRRAQRKPLDSEEIMLEVLLAQLAEAQGDRTDAIKKAQYAISLCENNGLLDLLHIPVMILSLIFAQLRHIDELSSLLKQYLPLMQEQQGLPYRDDLRRLWKILNQEQNHLPKVSEIIRLILNNDVMDFLDQKIQPTEFPEPPQNWGSDPLSAFLQTAQSNTIATYANNRSHFDALRSIEARLQITMSKASEVVIASGMQRVPNNFELEDIAQEDWLELFFLMRTHAAFLGAVRLATSAQYAETNMVLRGALENAMYCFRVTDDSNLKAVWFDKYKDGYQGSSYKRVVDKFSIKNIGARMAQVNPIISMNCASIYDALIDFGAHPNEKTFSALANVELNDDDITLSVITLHSDLLNNLLNNCIDVGLLVLEIVSLAMPGCTAAPPIRAISENQIEKVAYFRWLDGGAEHGSDMSHWLRAEAELRNQLF